MTTTQNSNLYLNPTIDILKCPPEYTDNGIECVLSPLKIPQAINVPCPFNSIEGPPYGPFNLVRDCTKNGDIKKKCPEGYVPNKDKTRCTKPCKSGYEQIGEKCAILCNTTEQRDGEKCIPKTAAINAMNNYIQNSGFDPVKLSILQPMIKDYYEALFAEPSKYCKNLDPENSQLKSACNCEASTITVTKTVAENALNSAINSYEVTQYNKNKAKYETDLSVWTNRYFAQKSTIQREGNFSSGCGNYCPNGFDEINKNYCWSSATYDRSCRISDNEVDRQMITWTAKNPRPTIGLPPTQITLKPINVNIQCCSQNISNVTADKVEISDIKQNCSQTNNIQSANDNFENKKAAESKANADAEAKAKTDALISAAKAKADADVAIIIKAREKASADAAAKASTDAAAKKKKIIIGISLIGVITIIGILIILMT